MEHNNTIAPYMPVSNPYILKLLKRSILLITLISAGVATAMELSDGTPDKTTYQTVTFYSEYHDHAVRWPDGKVTIFDKTGFANWQTIIERLQPFMPRVRLSIVERESDANIVVEGVETLPLPYAHTCGVTQNYIGADNASIQKSRIKIRRVDTCIGSNKELGLYMHELGHALGFARHTKDKDVMGTYENKGEVIHIQTLSAFLTGLYAIAPGTTFQPETSFDLINAPTDWSAVSGEVIARNTIDDEDSRQQVSLAKTDNREIVSVDLGVNKVEAPVVPVRKLIEPANTKPIEKINASQTSNNTYVTAASVSSNKLRPITIIGPTGVQTQWVMTETTQPKSETPKETAVKPRKK